MYVRSFFLRIVWLLLLSLMSSSPQIVALINAHAMAHTDIAICTIKSSGNIFFSRFDVQSPVIVFIYDVHLAFYLMPGRHSHLPSHCCSYSLFRCCWHALALALCVRANQFCVVIYCSDGSGSGVWYPCNSGGLKLFIRHGTHRDASAKPKTATMLITRLQYGVVVRFVSVE